MDRIRLRDLTLFPKLGVYDWEKEAVQKTSIDVELGLDLEPAAREDRVSATVDYSEVYALIQDVSKRRKYHLIESLAHEIAQAILERFELVESVRIRLRKLNLPFDAHLECVEVDMERSR